MGNVCNVDKVYDFCKYREVMDCMYKIAKL